VTTAKLAETDIL